MRIVLIMFYSAHIGATASNLSGNRSVRSKPGPGMRFLAEKQGTSTVGYMTCPNKVERELFSHISLKALASNGTIDVPLFLRLWHEYVQTKVENGEPLNGVRRITQPIYHEMVRRMQKWTDRRNTIAPHKQVLRKLHEELSIGTLFSPYHLS